MDVLTESWKKVVQIEEYADPLKHDPPERNLVALGEHAVKSQHHPELQILLQGHEIGSVKRIYTASGWICSRNPERQDHADSARKREGRRALTNCEERRMQGLAVIVGLCTSNTL